MSSNYSKHSSGFGAGKSKKTPSSSVPEVQKQTPFGVSVEDLEEVYARLKHFIRYDLVSRHFTNLDILNIFFNSEKLYTGEHHVSGLSLDELLYFFSPLEEIGGYSYSRWVGSNIIKQKKLICWFMGYKIPDENWSDASEFTKKNGQLIFNLKDSIFSYMKYRFNDAIDREDDGTSCVTVTHNFINLGNGDLDFETFVSLKTHREDFSEEKIDATIAKLGAKLDEEERKYQDEQVQADLYKKKAIDGYVRKLNRFCEKLNQVAAKTNIQLKPIDPMLIQVYAEFCYDAMRSGKTCLGSGKVISCTLSDIERDLKMNLGVEPISPAGCSVEKYMENGADLDHVHATKIASSNTAIGAGCA
jgi:hypothetical protein